MRELIRIIKTIEEGGYLELAEKELGEIPYRPLKFKECEEDHEGCFEVVDDSTPEEKDHKSKVYARSHEIEEEHWERFARIIKGQSKEEIKRDGYDGTGMMCWWD